MEEVSNGRSPSGRATAAEPVVSALRDGIPSANMSHDEALDAITGCAATVTVLSYQEAIEGYLKLRGIAP